MIYSEFVLNSGKISIPREQPKQNKRNENCRPGKDAIKTVKALKSLLVRELRYVTCSILQRTFNNIVQIIASMARLLDFIQTYIRKLQNLPVRNHKAKRFGNTLFNLWTIFSADVWISGGHLFFFFVFFFIIKPSVYFRKRGNNVN